MISNNMVMYIIQVNFVIVSNNYKYLSIFENTLYRNTKKDKIQSKESKSITYFL